MFRKKILIILFWLFIWQLLAMWTDNPILLAGPAQTLLTLLKLSGEAVFRQVVGFSLLRIGAGFLAGLFSALLLAALSARFSFFEDLLKPLMTLIKTVPMVSFVILLLIWWGSSFLAVAVCFLMVLPNVYTNTLEGIKAADRQLLEVARVFRLPFRNRFFYIYRPALRPFLYGSLKVSLGVCWKSGIAAEVIGIPELSVGERLYLAKISLDTPGVLAWTAAAVLLSIGFERLILYLAGLFFSWEPRCKKASSGSACGGGPFPPAQPLPGPVPLICENLSKAYGAQTVLRGFSAAYLPGNIYYLTGPSGWGKTTLLRLLCGLENPDGGSITGRGRFAVTFQEDRLCGEYSAVRNLELVTGNRRQAEDALLGLLEKDALHKPCSQLSGGMKRRVALVRAMEAESEFVLLDEPFTGMDEETRRLAADYIAKKQRGRTVIIATHIPSSPL